MESMDFSQISQLGIGVVAILVLGYVTREFIKHLKTIHEEHKAQLTALHTEHLVELKERELAIRSLESEVRNNITDQLSKNTMAMEKFATVLERQK